MICLRHAFWQEICSVRARENSNDKRQQAKDRKTSIWRDFHILKKNTYKWEKGDTYSFKIKSEASIKYKMQYYLSSKIVFFKKKEILQTLQKWRICCHSMAAWRRWRAHPLLLRQCQSWYLVAKLPIFDNSL